MAFCSAKVKLFCRNLMKYNCLKITSVKDQFNKVHPGISFSVF